MINEEPKPVCQQFFLGTFPLSNEKIKKGVGGLISRRGHTQE
jgi:hypothetical protein